MPRMTEVFKALSDPTRREILAMLRRGDMSAGEIAEKFSISKPSISHHLAQLKQAGLVSDIRRGQNIYYSLETTAFQDLLAWVLDIAGKASDKGDSGNEQQV